MTRQKFFTAEEPSGSPAVAAAGASINFTEDSFSRGLVFKGNIFYTFDVSIQYLNVTDRRTDRIAISIS